MRLFQSHNQKKDGNLHFWTLFHIHLIKMSPVGKSMWIPYLPPGSRPPGRYLYNLFVCFNNPGMLFLFQKPAEKQ